MNKETPVVLTVVVGGFKRHVRRWTLRPRIPLKRLVVAQCGQEVSLEGDACLSVFIVAGCGCLGMVALTAASLVTGVFFAAAAFFVFSTVG